MGFDLWLIDFPNLWKRGCEGMGLYQRKGELSVNKK